jgi:hypothetical protein
MRDAKEVAIIDLLADGEGNKVRNVYVKLVCINNYFSACTEKLYVRRRIKILHNLYIYCTVYTKEKDKRQGV